MKQITLLLMLQYFTIAGCFAQNFNRPVPEGMFKYEFVQLDTAYHGYYFTSMFRFNPNPNVPLTIPPTPLILDQNGYIVWYMQPQVNWSSEFKFFPDYMKFGFVTGNRPVFTYKLLDLDFNIIDSFSNTPGVAHDAHELLITSNGNYIIGGLSDSIMDLSAYTFNGVQGSTSTSALGFVVQEFDPLHNLVFEWDSNDHIHPSETYDHFGYNPNRFDYCHGNAIEEDFDGHLLVSLRHLNAVYKIHRTTGNVIWILGGRSSSFTFINDNGFSGQHDIRRLPNGNVSLFDNANMANAPRASRAVEYKLDTINWTATKAWEYKYAPPFFAIAMGNHQTTPERKHLLNYGLVFRPHPSITLVDDNGNVLTDIFFEDSVQSYRSYIFDLPFTLYRPEISCKNENGNIRLTAPTGHNSYEWSTGEKTPEIWADQAGTYQVWVNHGIGMAGSFPFIIENINDACLIIGIEEHKRETAKTITAVFDLQGRYIARPQKGQLYIIRYSNGTVEKKIWDF